MIPAVGRRMLTLALSPENFQRVIFFVSTDTSSREEGPGYHTELERGSNPTNGL